MANKIQFRRGVKANLPTLSVAEPAFTTDTNEFFIGNGSANVKIAKQSDLDIVNTSLSEKANQSDLNATNTDVSTNSTNISNHTSESVSQIVTFTRDLSLAGVQTVTIPAKTKHITAIAYVSSVVNKDSFTATALAVNSARGYSNFGNAIANTKIDSGQLIRIYDSNVNDTYGYISAIGTNSIDITWVKENSGATGTVTVILYCLMH